jgi:hypothetical protein
VVAVSYRMRNASLIKARAKMPAPVVFGTIRKDMPYR